MVFVGGIGARQPSAGGQITSLQRSPAPPSASASSAACFGAARSFARATRSSPRRLTARRLLGVRGRPSSFIAAGQGQSPALCDRFRTTPNAVAWPAWWHHGQAGTIGRTYPDVRSPAARTTPRPNPSCDLILLRLGRPRATPAAHAAPAAGPWTRRGHGTAWPAPCRAG